MYVNLIISLQALVLCVDEGLFFTEILFLCVFPCIQVADIACLGVALFNFSLLFLFQFRIMFFIEIYVLKFIFPLETFQASAYSMCHYVCGDRFKTA